MTRTLLRKVVSRNAPLPEELMAKRRWNKRF
jgi:hypothetical protein